VSHETGTGQIAKAIGFDEKAVVGLRYEDGGKIQVVTLPDGTEYRLPGAYHNWNIIAALKEIRNA